MIDAVLTEEGHPPASVCDFVHGITAEARAEPRQDARLVEASKPGTFTLVWSR